MTDHPTQQLLRGPALAGQGRWSKHKLICLRLGCLTLLAASFLSVADEIRTKIATGSSLLTPETANASSGSSGSVVDESNTNIAYSGGIMDALNNRQKLAVGDTVIFQVLEDQEDPKLLAVTDAGQLDVPELGLVSAAGKTCKQLAFELKPKLEQTTYYHATLIIGIKLFNKTISGRRVYLAGQVRNTGPQEIPAGESWTVSRAIMGAGGFTDYADKKQVRLVRAGAKGTPGKTVILNIADVWEKGKTEKDMSVEPEDLIYVPGRAVNF